MSVEETKLLEQDCFALTSAKKLVERNAQDRMQCRRWEMFG